LAQRFSNRAKNTRHAHLIIGVRTATRLPVLRIIHQKRIEGDLVADRLWTDRGA
jgi:hypothetical protein